MIKAIKKFFSYLFNTVQLGFYTICLVLSHGFFFYFYLICNVLEKIFHAPIFTKGKNYFRMKEADPVTFLMIVLLFFVGVFLHTYLYVDNSSMQHIEEDALISRVVGAEVPTEGADPVTGDTPVYNPDSNLYRKFGKTNLNEVDFNYLRSINQDVVAWVSVDGTNINYPIVQSSDNDYYLGHDIMRSPKASGWTFMDYRNNPDFSDQNTIFYGHNLLNKTAFGSLSNLFTDKWYKSSNHYIIVETPSARRIYKVFSIYYTDAEVYYLQNRFYRDSDYQEFLNVLKGRSMYDFGVEVTANDRILTLSTCSDSNNGRKAVHAKLVG